MIKNVRTAGIEISGGPSAWDQQFLRRTSWSLPERVRRSSRFWNSASVKKHTFWIATTLFGYRCLSPVTGGVSVFHTFLIASNWTFIHDLLINMKLGQHDTFVLDVPHRNNWSVYMSRSTASHWLLACQNVGLLQRHARKLKLLCTPWGATHDL